VCCCVGHCDKGAVSLFQLVGGHAGACTPHHVEVDGHIREAATAEQNDTGFSKSLPAGNQEAHDGWLHVPKQPTQQMPMPLGPEHCVLQLA
jgi:hypothetical protein